MHVRTGDGLEWRVAKGAKTAGDLVLEVRTATGWQRIKMAAGFLMADFLAENEDVLVSDGYFPATAAGGGYYLKHVRTAVSRGWRFAADKLEGEREARRSRESHAPVAEPRCVTCGAEPVGTFTDGSPRYACGPHEPTSTWVDGINPFVTPERRAELLALRVPRLEDVF